jgi:hypothetical protein
MNLEPELRALATEIAWPETPPLRPQFEPRRRQLRRPLLVAVAAGLSALAVAFAVPQSRAAILRFLHLGAVTIQFVDRLPAAQERPLGAHLGRTVPLATARGALQDKLLLPPLTPPPPLHESEGIISMLFRYHGETVLLSEIYIHGNGLLKKLYGLGTHVTPVLVGRDPGVWISGAPHVHVFPSAPPRLAHNVLIWQNGALTLRLEGRALTKATAETLARALR